MKAIILILTICLLLFSACSVNTEPNPTRKDYTIVDIDFPWYRSMEDYTAYTQGTQLLENFVSYEALCDFGEFVSFLNQYLPDASFDWCNPISKYIVCDKNAQEVFIQIYYWEDWTDRDKDYPNTLEFTSDMHDMRTHPSGLTGRIYRDNIEYAYDEGKLSYIYWYVDNLLFSLRIWDSSIKLAEYPLDKEETLVSRLLSKDPAVAGSVIEELEEKLK